MALLSLFCNKRVTWFKNKNLHLLGRKLPWTEKAFPFSRFHWEMLWKPFTSWFVWKGQTLVVLFWFGLVFFGLFFFFLKDSYLEGLPFWRALKINCKNKFWFLHKFSQFTTISASSGCLHGMVKHFNNGCNYADTVPHVVAVTSL